MLTLWCAHSSLIAWLEREVEYFKLQYESERRRAEMAIDELLRMRVQAGPVRAGLEERVPEQVERLLKDPEFTRVGELEG